MSRSSLLIPRFKNAGFLFIEFLRGIADALASNNVAKKSIEIEPFIISDLSSRILGDCDKTNSGTLWGAAV
jgi:hypothetical protein